MGKRKNRIPFMLGGGNGTATLLLCFNVSSAKFLGGAVF
jgi:hypothetical protein